MSKRVHAVILIPGPRALDPIAGVPLLELWLRRLAEAAIDRVYLAADSRMLGLLRGVYEAPAETAAPLTTLLPALPEATDAAAVAAVMGAEAAEGLDTLVVIPGGAFSDVNLARMMAFHGDQSHDVTAALYHEAHGDPATFVQLGARKRIVFTTDDRVPSELALTGIYAIPAPRCREVARAYAADPSATILEACRHHIRGWPWVWYHRDVAPALVLQQVRADAPAILAEVRRKGRPAVFLDRDGTLIEEVNYLSDPGSVRVLPGVAKALRRLRAGGYARVVVTNQSAVGRGIITLDRLHEIHEAMHDRLYEQHAAVDAVYFCPDAPGELGAPDSDDARRKPGAGMLIAAAAELGLDLEASWMVGDQVGDLIAGQRAGCRGSILVQTGQGPGRLDASGVPHEVAADLLAASEIILSGGRRDPSALRSPVPA